MRRLSAIVFSRLLWKRATLRFVPVVIFAVFSPFASEARQEPIRIGVASMITPVDTVKYYQEIIGYIGDRKRHPVQMVHRRTYEEMDDLLERGDVKIAFR